MNRDQRRGVNLHQGGHARYRFRVLGHGPRRRAEPVFQVVTVEADGVNFFAAVPLRDRKVIMLVPCRQVGIAVATDSFPAVVAGCLAFQAFASPRHMIPLALVEGVGSDPR